MCGLVARARLLELFDRLSEAVTMRYLPEEPARGERPDYANSHLTIAGASTRRMIAIKLHAGRPLDLADLDVLLREAGVETRRAAAGLHELTQGAKPMAAEPDLQLIKRYGGQPDRDIGLTR